MNSKARARDLVARSRSVLRSEGYTLIHTAESFTKFGRSADAWGVVDVIAFRPKSPPLFLQVTTQNGLSAHKKKITESPNTDEILRNGLFLVHAWRQHPTSRRWSLRVVNVKEWFT